MNRKIATLVITTALSASIATLDVLSLSNSAGAVTPNVDQRPIIREYDYPSFERKYPNMPGTNFRAARPEEYPRIFGGDCGLWRRGRTLFECEDFSPRRRRNPQTR